MILKKYREIFINEVRAVNKLSELETTGHIYNVNIGDIKKEDLICGSMKELHIEYVSIIASLLASKTAFDNMSVVKKTIILMYATMSGILFNASISKKNVDTRDAVNKYYDLLQSKIELRKLSYSLRLEGREQLANMIDEEVKDINTVEKLSYLNQLSKTAQTTLKSSVNLRS